MNAATAPPPPVTPAEITKARLAILEISATLEVAEDEVRGLLKSAIIAGQMLDALAARFPETEFEQWATKHLCADYSTVFGIMKFSRLYERRLPKFISRALKVLLIAFDREEKPIPTPRRERGHRIVDLAAAARNVRVWWRDGEVVAKLEPHQRRAVVRQLEPIRDVLDKLDGKRDKAK